MFSSKSFGSILISISVLIVAKTLEILASSIFSSTFSFCLPFNSWVLIKRLSKVSYFCISFKPVIFPMPGIPGMLSAVSPIIAFKSITWSGLIWYSASKLSFVTSKISDTPLRIKSTLVLSSTNCSISWSLVKIFIWMSLYLFDKVPIISSAS